MAPVPLVALLVAAQLAVVAGLLPLPLSRGLRRPLMAEPPSTPPPTPVKKVPDLFKSVFASPFFTPSFVATPEVPAETASVEAAVPSSPQTDATASSADSTPDIEASSTSLRPEAEVEEASIEVVAAVEPSVASEASVADSIASIITAIAESAEIVEHAGESLAKTKSLVDDLSASLREAAVPETAQVASTADLSEAPRVVSSPPVSGASDEELTIARPVAVSDQIGEVATGSSDADDLVTSKLDAEKSEAIDESVLEAVLEAALETVVLEAVSSTVASVVSSASAAAERSTAHDVDVAEASAASALVERSAALVSPPPAPATTTALTQVDKAQVNSTSAAMSAPTVALPAEKIVRQPANTSYFVCSACKSSYLVSSPSLLGVKGARVRCQVCEKEWFQTNDRVMKTDDVMVLETMSLKAIGDVKRIIADKNWPKFPRVNKQGIFVGNLPYTYDETQIGELFAEYGVTGVSLVKDPEGQSKGFAFVEVSSEEDAALLIKEMHWFYTDPTRRLTVRSAQTQTERKASPAGAYSGPPRPSGGGGGGSGKAWVPRGGGGERKSY